MIPPFDPTKPKSLTQDAALAVDVLRRFKEGPGAFTPGDAGRVISVIERLYHALTDRTELYAMGLMVEEKAEVLKLIGKALRFGLDTPGPDGPPYNGQTARQMLPAEIGDTHAAIRWGAMAGLFSMTEANEAESQKMARLLDPNALDAQGNRLAPDLGKR